MVKRNKLIIPFVLIVFLYVFFQKNEKLPIEELSIPAGIGTDITKAGDSLKLYNIPLCIYVYKDQEISSKVIAGNGLTIAASRETRSLKQDKRFTLGLEKVYVDSEDYAKEGIKESIDVLFRNPSVNDTAYMVICKGKAEDMLKLKVEQYPSSSDYIEGLIKNSINENFFSGDYQVVNEYVRLNVPGRIVVMPYITIEEGKPKISGSAYFKGDKLAGVLNNKDSKYRNLLSRNAKKGIFTIKNSKNNYIDYDCTVKRKVICKRVKNIYYFTIKLALKGSIISNETKLKISQKPMDLAEAEKEFDKSITKDCEEFIKRMQEDYKVDLLELGRFAAAKYGRKNNYKNIIENSKINVQVDVKIESQGRGDY